MEVFDSKYSEFARDLEGSCPELASQIGEAMALSVEERRDQFKRQVLPFCSPNRGLSAPGLVLPGVSMPPELWNSLSDKSKKAIQEYLTLLSFTLLIDSGTKGDLSGAGWNATWANKMMDDMKKKMENMDFSGITEKMA
jgi:hypothetical protein